MSSSWTSRAESSTVRSHICPVFRGLIFPAIRFCLFSGLIFTLSACDLSALTGSSSNPPATAVPAPPGGGDRPPEPGQLGRATGADGLPTLRAPMGVNVSVDTLFAEDIKDPVERIKRVENAVVEMRRDFDQTLPAIKRLVAVEKDMQTLMVQLESLLSGNADDATVSGAMAPQNSPDSSTLEGVEEQVDTSLPTSGIPTPEVQVEKISAVPQDSRSVNTVSSAAAVSAPVSPVPAAAPVQPAIQAPISAPAQQPAPSPVSAPAAAIPSPVAQQPAIQAPIALPAPAPAPAVAPVPVIPAPVAAPTAAPAPVPAAPIQAQTPVMSAPPVVAPRAGAISALGTRLGESAGSTRIVIDLDGAAVYKADLDNQERILVIEVEGAQYKGQLAQIFNGPLVRSLNIQAMDDGRGFRLIVVLSRQSAVMYSSMLLPAGANPHHRIVVDLKK